MQAFQHFSLSACSRSQADARFTVGQYLCESLLLPVVSGGGVWTQPQGDVLRLHRLPDHPDQLLTQGGKVRLLPQPGGKGVKRLRCVVLAALEAPVDKRLDAPSKRAE